MMSSRCSCVPEPCVPSPTTRSKLCWLFTFLKYQPLVFPFTPVLVPSCPRARCRFSPHLRSPHALPVRLTSDVPSIPMLVSGLASSSFRDAVTHTIWYRPTVTYSHRACVTCFRLTLTSLEERIMVCKAPYSFLLQTRRCSWQLAPQPLHAVY